METIVIEREQHPEIEIDGLIFVANKTFFEIFDEDGNGVAVFSKEYTDDLINFLTKNK